MKSPRISDITRKEDIIKKTTPRSSWIVRIFAIVGLFFCALALGAFILSRADGPTFVFAGGPMISGTQVGLTDVDWVALDELHEFEVEIVGAATSRTLWFSTFEGVPYIACDLDCIGGLLTRWPQQIERDDRVVVRIDKKLMKGRLIHVPHETAEYEAARAARELKYSGGEGGRAASETAAHSTVVGVGEVLTGRSKRKEPGDRLFRVGPP
jgi:hypothetical protein